jgi:hypothetical protein
MRHVLMLATFVVLSHAARAEDSMTVPWNDLCRTTSYQVLTITTSDAGMVKGSCSGVQGNDLSIVDARGMVVTVNRAAISHIQMKPSRNRMSDLGQVLKLEAFSAIGSLLTLDVNTAVACAAVALFDAAIVLPYFAFDSLIHRAKVTSLNVI